MTTQPTPSPDAARLERTYHAPAELIWELFTTASEAAARRQGQEQGHQAGLPTAMATYVTRVLARDR